jgi:hypothetical protein
MSPKSEKQPIQREMRLSIAALQTAPYLKDPVDRAWAIKIAMQNACLCPKETHMLTQITETIAQARNGFLSNEQPEDKEPQE